MISEVMLGIVIMMTALQQSLGGDAPHIETGAAERTSHFNAGCFETELTGLNGGYVPSGPAADHYDVVLGERGGGGEAGS